ncbi:PqqD family protein [Micromonospora sp. FIMYZ51]|uniref:PqqD family protein n=1 Tax=Micromonospora sp. FIMYZ51 TaxID=3051832 RepID=UPI00312010DB
MTDRFVPPSLEWIPQRRLEARIRRFRGRTLVAVDAEAMELDEVAAFIFGQVDGATSLREIGERVAATYDVSVEEATTDSAELLAQLVDVNLVGA